MDRVRVASALRSILSGHAKIAVEPIEDHHVLTRDLAFDSLAFVLSMTDIEQQLKVAMPLERIDELQDITFGELVSLVHGLRTGDQSSARA